MNFLEENYVVILIIIIISIMAFIGYLADKTDFGRKKLKKQEKSNVENKKKPKPEKIKIEAKGINDISNDINEVDKLKPNNEQIDQALFEPLEKNDNNEKEINKPEKEVIEKPEEKEEDIWKF